MSIYGSEDNLNRWYADHEAQRAQAERPGDTMKHTNTPYDGKLTAQQQAEILDLLWGSMKREPGYDRVHTGWGTKTQTGLLKCIESILQKGGE